MQAPKITAYGATSCECLAREPTIGKAEPLATLIANIDFAGSFSPSAAVSISCHRQSRHFAGSPPVTRSKRNKIGTPTSKCRYTRRQLSSHPSSGSSRYVLVDRPLGNATPHCWALLAMGPDNFTQNGHNTSRTPITSRKLGASNRRIVILGGHAISFVLLF